MRYELKQWVENFGQSYAGPQKINRFAHYILYGTKPERTGPRAAQEAEVLLFCTRCKVPLDDYPDDDGNADALDDSFGDDGIINHPQGGMTVKYVTGHVEVVRPDWTEVMPYCVECSDSLSICRECGCTTEVACMNDGKACLWVEDDLCSACVKEEEPTDA